MGESFFFSKPANFVFADIADYDGEIRTAQQGCLFSQ